MFLFLQVTVHIGLSGNPVFVKTAEGTKKVQNYHLHFYGIKVRRAQNTDVRVRLHPHTTFARVSQLKRQTQIELNMTVPYRTDWYLPMHVFLQEQFRCSSARDSTPHDNVVLLFQMESTTQQIKVEQSQSDRSKKPFHPVK